MTLYQVTVRLGFTFDANEKTDQNYVIISKDDPNVQLHVHTFVLSNLEYFKGLLKMHPKQLVTENFSELSLIICTLYDPTYLENYFKDVEDFTFEQLLTMISLYAQIIMIDPYFVEKNKIYENYYNPLHTHFLDKHLDRVHELFKYDMPKEMFEYLYETILEVYLEKMPSEVYQFVEMKDNKNNYLFPHMKMMHYIKQDKNNFKLSEIFNFNKMRTINIEFFSFYLIQEELAKISEEQQKILKQKCFEERHLSVLYEKFFLQPKNNDSTALTTYDDFMMQKLHMTGVVYRTDQIHHIKFKFIASNKIMFDIIIRNVTFLYGHRYSDQYNYVLTDLNGKFIETLTVSPDETRLISQDGKKVFLNNIVSHISKEYIIHQEKKDTCIIDIF